MTTPLPIIPDHPCPGEGCEHPRVMSFVATDSPMGGVDTTTTVHLLDTNEIAQTLIRMYDTIAVNEDSDLPLVIRFARNREALRKAIENVTPPAEVSQAISELSDGDDE